MNSTLDINILKFVNWQSLVPGLVCDLPRCVERPLCNALKYEFLRGIIAYKQLRMLMLQKKKELFSIFNLLLIFIRSTKTFGYVY